MNHWQSSLCRSPHPWPTLCPGPRGRSGSKPTSSCSQVSEGSLRCLWAVWKTLHPSEQIPCMDPCPSRCLPTRQPLPQPPRSQMICCRPQRLQCLQYVCGYPLKNYFVGNFEQNVNYMNLLIAPAPSVFCLHSKQAGLSFDPVWSWQARESVLNY